MLTQEWRRAFIEDYSASDFPKERCAFVNCTASTDAKISSPEWTSNRLKRKWEFQCFSFSLPPPCTSETEQADLSPPMWLAPSLHAPQSREQRSASAASPNCLTLVMVRIKFNEPASCEIEGNLWLITRCNKQSSSYKVLWGMLMLTFHENWHESKQQMISYFAIPIQY